MFATIILSYISEIFGKIYAYETDGFGNYNLMDNANIPSLLSIHYIDYEDEEIDYEIYQIH